MSNRQDELARFVKEVLPYFKVGAAVAVSALAAPVWESLRIVGNQLYLDWSIVPNAGYYELWRNASASTTGMELVKVTPATQHIIPVNVSVGELIVNGGFESGDFAAWYADSGWSVVSSDKHSGTYCAKGEEMGGHGITRENHSNYFGVEQGKTYTLTAWVKVPYCSTSQFSIEIEFTDTLSPTYPFGSALYAEIAYSTSTTVAGWTQVTYTVTCPVGYNFARINLYALGGGGGVTAYVDDISLSGQATVSEANLYYAVRAVAYGTVFSQFSTWLKPNRAPSTLGTPSVPSVVGDYDNALVGSTLADEITEAGWTGGTENISAGYMRAGRIAGWGPFAVTDDAIARGLASSESDSIGFVLGDYAGGNYLLYTVARGLVIASTASRFCALDYSTSTTRDDFATSSYANSTLSITRTLVGTTARVDFSVWADSPSGTEIIDLALNVDGGTDNLVAKPQLTSGAAPIQVCASYVFTGLSAGSHTFRLRGKSDSGGATVRIRGDYSKSIMNLIETA